MRKQPLLVIVLLTSFALPVFPAQPSSSQTKSTEDVAPQQPQQSGGRQVTVTDVLTKESQVVATEWIDFEIVM